MELVKNSYDRYVLLTQTEQIREESAEVIVPDTLADVYGVLTANAVCQIKQRSLKKDALLLEGVVEMEAVCLTEEESCQFVRGSIPFSQEYALPGCRPEDVAEVHLEPVRAEALLRNPRKLQLQTQLSLQARVYQRQQLTLSEGLRGAPEEGVQTLTEQVELEVLRAVAEKKVTAADEIRLNASGRLLQYEVEWRQEEQRILTGKLMLRGNVCLRAVLLDGQETRVQEALIPYSQVMECESVESGDAVTVEYQTMQSQVSLLEGEQPTLSCSITGCAWAKAVRRQRFSVLQDAYSTGYESECTTEALNCPAPRQVETAIPVSQVFAAEEPAGRIVNCRWCARGGTEEGRMLGQYTFRVLYCCSRGRLHCAEHTVTVTAEEPVCLEQLSVRACLRELICQAESDGRISIRFRAVLQGRGQVCSSCRQVSACTLEKEKPRALPPAGTLVLRCAEPKETVWSIARQYGARREEILSANRLEEGSLKPGQLILIPFSR